MNPTTPSEPTTPAAIKAREFRRTLRAVAPFYAFTPQHADALDTIRRMLAGLYLPHAHSGESLFLDEHATELTDSGKRLVVMLDALIANAPVANESTPA